MFGFSWQEILNKYYYSSGDSKTPMKVAIGSIVINLVLALILSRTLMGIYGIALSSAVSITYAAVALYILQNKRDGKSTTVRMALFLIKMLSALVVCGVVMFAMQYALLHLALGRFVTLIALIICFALSCVVYLASAKALRIDEVRALMSSVFGKIKGGEKEKLQEGSEQE